VNDIKASLAFGTALVVLGGWLIRWHRIAWKSHRDDDANDDREKHHYWLQFRRRIQVAVLMIVLGVLIPLGDWLTVQNKNPKWFAVFILAVLAITAWLMLLAMLDWLSTRMHVRATRATLAGLDRKRRELEAEVERLRNQGSNGRH
jgi:hypothetical protein